MDEFLFGAWFWGWFFGLLLWDAFAPFIVPGFCAIAGVAVGVKIAATSN